MSTKLIIIRHGETDWNLNKRYCGFRDVSLNATGRSQAKSLCRRLKREKIKVDKVYTSNMKRAVETAKIIFGRIKMEAVPGLREMHFGVFEGFTHKEITAKYADVYTKWLDDPFSVTVPRGESMLKFKKRIVVAFKKIISTGKGKTTAVVCHGGVMSIYLTYILKSKDFWAMIPHSTGISIIEFRKNKPVIKLLNCSMHLK